MSAPSEPADCGYGMGDGCQWDSESPFPPLSDEEWEAFCEGAGIDPYPDENGS